MTIPLAVSTSARNAWPDIFYEPWRETCSALHLYAQIVGKYPFPGVRQRCTLAAFRHCPTLSRVKRIATRSPLPGLARRRKGRLSCVLFLCLSRAGRFADAHLAPDAAYYEQSSSEFVLPYDAVRHSSDPEAALTTFLESTYQAAADLGEWDREALECLPGEPRRPRLL